MNNFNWDSTFSAAFDLHDGYAAAPSAVITDHMIRMASAAPAATPRHLSQMKDMYQDREAAEKLLEDGDPLIYEFYELGAPERDGDLAFGTTIIHPGKVGNEYYMTKGHFHKKVMTSEVYYTLSGRGYMMMENMAGDWMAAPLVKGEALYVPRGYAHRTVNTGGEDLVAFYVFAADAGHDYGTIETKGFRHIVVEEGDESVIRENPAW